MVVLLFCLQITIHIDFHAGMLLCSRFFSHFFLILFFFNLNFTVAICAQLIGAYEQSEYFFYGVLDNRLQLDKDRLFSSAFTVDEQKFSFIFLKHIR